ncbi:hypothetical protein [Halopelagius fulvigenes]|uniref:Uncharacterized protein n=1 Tax=Halopelagius fulvigenes TaxID=1198324 RepID=A0ABD5U068_9EURY
MTRTTRRTEETRTAERTRRPTEEEDREAPLVPIIDTTPRRYRQTERTRRPTDEEDAEAPLVPLIETGTDPDAEYDDVRREIANLKTQLNRIESTLGGSR